MPGLHDWPLVVFTVFCQTAIGGFWVLAYAILAGQKPPETQAKLERATLPLWILAGLGFLASTVHLGMPFRGINALNRIGHAPLSNEIFTGILFLSTGGLHWLLSMTQKGSTSLKRFLLMAAVLASIGFLASMISFYMMPTVPTWNNITTPLSFVLTSLMAGILFGAMLLNACNIPMQHRALFRIMFIAVMVSLGVTLIQAYMLPQIETSLRNAASLVPHYSSLMIIRYTLIALAILMWACAYRSACATHNKASSRACGSLLLPCVCVIAAEMIGRGIFYDLYMTVGLL